MLAPPPHAFGAMRPHGEHTDGRALAARQWLWTALRSANRDREVAGGCSLVSRIMACRAGGRDSSHATSHAAGEQDDAQERPFTWRHDSTTDGRPHCAHYTRWTRWRDVAPPPLALERERSRDDGRDRDEHGHARSPTDSGPDHQAPMYARDAGMWWDAQRYEPRPCPALRPPQWSSSAPAPWRDVADHDGHDGSAGGRGDRWPADGAVHPSGVDGGGPHDADHCERGTEAAAQPARADQQDDDGDLCAITLEPLAALQRCGCVTALPCGHRFETNALAMHLDKVGRFCPLCRSSVLVDPP